MEDQLKNHAEEILQKVKEGAEFAGDQAPIFIQEYLGYYTFHHVVIVLLLAVLVFILFSWTKKLHKGFNGEMVAGSFWDELAENGFGDFVYFLLVVGIGVNIVFIVINGFNLVKILLAPRLYIVEHLMSLFK